VVSQYYKGEEGIDPKLDSKNDIRYANQSKILNDLKNLIYSCRLNSLVLQIIVFS
jgi:hypothetical protein